MSEDAFSLAGRVAVVTGAASGIGRATALVLANAGAHVAGGDLDETGLEETAAQVRQATPRAQTLWLAGDVSVRADVETLVERAMSEWDRVDAMANVPASCTAARWRRRARPISTGCWPST